MKSIAQKRAILVNRRTTVMQEIETYQKQTTSKDRYVRKHASRVLEYLYMEQFQINHDLRRLARREATMATFSLIFSR